MSRTIRNTFGKTLAVFLAIAVIVTFTPMNVFGASVSTDNAAGAGTTAEEGISAQEYEYIEITGDGTAVVTTPEIPEYEKSCSISYVNPLYEGIELPASEKSSRKFYAANNPYFSSTETAADYVRDCMVKRKNQICFDMFAIFSDNWAPALQDYILRHTENPLEGDYLNLSLYKFDINGIPEAVNSDGTELVVHVTIDVQYLTTAAQEEELTGKLKSVTDGLKLDGLTDYGKAKAIYGYITENVKYDFEGLDDDSDYLKYSAYGALVENSAVCQGYAALLYRMLLEQGIDSRVITSDKLNHAWNIAELSGMYYYMDSTWDSASDGQTAREEYFLKGKSDFMGHDTDDSQCGTPLYNALYPMAERAFNESAPEKDSKYDGMVAKGQCGENAAWILKGDGSFIVMGAGDMWDVSSKGVTPIKNILNSISKVEFEEGITSVGAGFFRKAPNLKYAVFSDSIERIGTFAFLGCGLLANVELPKNLKSLEQQCFDQCDSMTEFVIPGKITFFDHPCGGKNLKKVVFRWDDSNTDRIKYASGSFALAEALEEITVDEKHKFLQSADGVLYGKGTLEDSNTGTTCENTLVAYPCGKSGEQFSVPEWSTGIGFMSFYGVQNLQSVLIHDKVTVIDTLAFSSTKKLGLITMNCPVPADSSDALMDYKGTIYYAGCTDTGWNQDDVRKRWAPQATWVSGHNVSDWTVTRAATCEEKGADKGVCQSCGKEARRKVIPALGHQVLTKITPATTSASGKIVKTCERKTCGKLLSSTVIPKIASVTLSDSKLAYSGKAKAPGITVTDAKGNLLFIDEDFTVSGMDNRVNVGRYKVTVSFKGKYSGRVTKYFTIVPKAPATATAALTTQYSKTSGYDDVKFSWAKSTGATGYKVYYRKASAAKNILLGTTSGTSMSIKNLEDGVKYIFKVVPYYTASNNYNYTALAGKTAYVYTLKKLAAPTLTRSGTKVKVKWNNIYGESGYQISRSTSSTGTNIVSTYETTSGTYKLVSATKGKKYYYKVRAYKTVGKTKIYGPWSKVTSFTR